MHGKDANRLAMMRRAEKFSSLGYSALVFDFQAHGESEGDRVTLGLLESMDATAAVRFAKTLSPGRPVITLGASLGGAAFLLARPKIESDLLIVESVYPDIKKAVENRLNALVPYSGFLAPLLTMQLEIRLGKPAEWFSPVNAAREIQIPTLVLSGDKDTHTTDIDTKRLFEAFGGRKELVFVEGAGHVDLELYDPTQYWAVVENFIKRHLKYP